MVLVDCNRFLYELKVGKGFKLKSSFMYSRICHTCFIPKRCDKSYPILIMDVLVCIMSGLINFINLMLTRVYTSHNELAILESV